MFAVNKSLRPPSNARPCSRRHSDKRYEPILVEKRRRSPDSSGVDLS